MEPVGYRCGICSYLLDALAADKSRRKTLVAFFGLCSGFIVAISPESPLKVTSDATMSSRISHKECTRTQKRKDPTCQPSAPTTNKDRTAREPRGHLLRVVHGRAHTDTPTRARVRQEPSPRRAALPPVPRVRKMAVRAGRYQPRKPTPASAKSSADSPTAPRKELPEPSARFSTRTKKAAFPRRSTEPKRETFPAFPRSTPKGQTPARSTSRVACRLPVLKFF